MWPFNKSSSSSTQSPIIETGLRAIDLLAPIPHGGDISVTGEMKAGTKVLANELAYRLMNFQHDAFRVVIFLDNEFESVDVQLREMQEYFPSLQDICVTASVSVQDIHAHLSPKSALKHDAVFAWAGSERFVQHCRQAINTARENLDTSRSLTTFIVTEQMNVGACDAKLFSTRMLAQEGIYPALDVRLSASSGLSHSSLNARRRHISDAVKLEVGEVLENLYSGALGDPQWNFTADPKKRSAVQALRFFSQPYFAAERYTGLKAAYVPIEQTIREFEAILSGICLALPAKKLMFQNELST